MNSLFFLEHILKHIFAFSIPFLVKVYYSLMCLSACVRVCTFAQVCAYVYICVFVWDYKGWLIQMRDPAGYHTRTRHSECMHAFVSDCLYFNELGLSLQCCTLQRLFTQDKCDNNPPPPHPADYPPLTHPYINILTQISQTSSRTHCICSPEASGGTAVKYILSALMTEDNA